MYIYVQYARRAYNMYIIFSETTTPLDAPIRPLHDFILAFFFNNAQNSRCPRGSVSMPV